MTIDQILVGATLLFIMFAGFFIYQMFRDCQFKPSTIKLSDDDYPHKANKPTLHSYAQAQISFDKAIAAGLLEQISSDKAHELSYTERLVYEVGIMDSRLTIILNIGDQSLCIENKKEGFFEEMPSYYAEII